MLSINIPVFNTNISELIKSLDKQIKKLSVDAEIRVFDDGSEEEFKIINRKICAEFEVVYVEMSSNTGRSAIRNNMGIGSKFSYLLFIDSDSGIPNSYFLEKYISECKEDLILCGGTCYSNKPPVEEGKILRWVYGRKRESVPASKRNHKKGFIITSNNFVIPKNTFEKIHFREDIKGYGHEDTLLGFDLFRNGFKIKHIDNPVEHLGLEDSVIFLNKTKQAVENLHFIHSTLLENDIAFCKQMPFLNQYQKISAFIPRCIIRVTFTLMLHFIEKNLTSNYPRLFLYDFYKLGWYSKIKSRR